MFETRRGVYYRCLAPMSGPECIAPDEALAMSFLYYLWVASFPDFFAGLEEFLFINSVYVIHDLICLHHIWPFTSVLKWREFEFFKPLSNFFYSIPSTSLVARRCTLSIFSLSFLYTGWATVMQYSTLGLTSVLYKFVKGLVSICLKCLIIMLRSNHVVQIMCTLWSGKSPSSAVCSVPFAHWTKMADRAVMQRLLCELLALINRKEVQPPSMF